MMIVNETVVLPRSRRIVPEIKIEKPGDCSLAGCSAISLYEVELEKHKATEAKLKKYVARERALRRQKNILIRQKDMLAKESEHRLLNGLQLVTGLLSMQSRAANNAEAAALLTVASNRVAAIGRVHRHLHTLDHVESVEFKPYLESLCHDLAEMSSDQNPESILSVEGPDLRLPSAVAIPLGFMASELVTNAIKYARGRITVRLRSPAEGGHSLSVSDDGPGLPEAFNPAAGRGLGMKIIDSLVRQIGGSLLIAKGDNGIGTCFTIALHH